MLNCSADKVTLHILLFRFETRGITNLLINSWNLEFVKKGKRVREIRIQWWMGL